MDYPFHSSFFVQQRFEKGLWGGDDIVVPRVS
jgi:hypothetical protein